MNMHIEGRAHKYGDNVDTDVIIPARYLNIADKKELASHAMEDIDGEFINKVKPGDIMLAGENFGCGSSRLIIALEAHQGKTYHLDLGKNVTRSNLSKANQNRDYRIFESLAYYMVVTGTKKTLN